MNHDECPQEEVILALQKNQIEQNGKIDLVLENQKVLATDLKQTLDRLTSIIEEDIGTRKDVEQGKKDVERLYDFRRKDVNRIEAIEIRNARCDGLGVFDKFPKVWDFYKSHAGKEDQFEKVWARHQQDTGVRRFIPAATGLLSFLILLWVTFGD